jgi:glucose-1-phosphate adenylyltransferase
MGSDFYQTLEVLKDSKENDKPIMGIGDNCYIKNAIIDKNCFVGNNVRIEGGPHLENGDYEKYTVNEGIVVLKKNAVIPNNFTI